MSINSDFTDWNPVEEFPFKDATVAELVSGGGSSDEDELPAVND